MKLNTLDRLELTEQLARKFYQMQGCVYDEDKLMIHTATHPTERLCVQQAKVAVETILNFTKA